MGERGPSGKPTALRVLHGDRKDRINTDEPVPPSGLPAAPEGMSDDVRAVWDYTVSILGPMRLATPADRDALACYCEAVVTHRKASAGLAQTGIIVRTSRGNTPMRNPLLAVQRDAAALIRVFAREFGLTPSARAGISLGDGNTSSGAGPERLLS
jgi:P27 family predicted phage terminase small subunit